MYRVISPAKIIKKRGTRSRREIAESVGNKVTEQDLYSYETGKWKPSDKKVPHLLLALECDYEDISEPVELARV